MDRRDAIDYLEEKVRSYEGRISQLQAKRDALETAIKETQALLNSAQVLLKDELQAARNASGAEISSFPLAARLANLNLTESIFEIVNSSPGRIHADQVLKKLREAGKTPKGKSPKNTVVSLLHRGVDQGMYFKVGPNLFAPIREREKAMLANEEASQQPIGNQAPKLEH